MFKRLLATGQSVPEDEEASPVHQAGRAKSTDVERLNDVLVPLVFYNAREWFEQDDSWVAECLAEWADSEVERLFASSLRDDAGQSDLEMFIVEFGGVVEQWQAQYEQAQPEPNPDFDPDEPVEGTQFYKYAKLPGTQDFQWLYASRADSEDWQTLQSRYDQYESKVEVRHTEVIEPYGDYFMKAVDGAWRFGRTRNAKEWYGDYELMLRKEGLLPATPQEDAAASSEDIRPYGDHFMKAVDGKWRYGTTREAKKWYGDYQLMLREEGLAPAEPVSVKKTVALFEAALKNLDPRVLSPDGEVSPDVALDAFESPAGQEFFGGLTARLTDEHVPQLDSILDTVADLGVEELEGLLKVLQQGQE
jgi:hypothetical protein